MNGINPKQVIEIYNLLRSLGLNMSLKGSKLLNKAIQIMITCNDEFITSNDIYSLISKEYCHSTPKQIKNHIAYCLNSRIKEKSMKNFKIIFGFEYNEYIFTNKNFIEEISHILKMQI